jgi:hypothetical protein
VRPAPISPLAEQDRSRPDSGAIAGGVRLITETMARAPLGPFQIQAAIAAVHAEAALAEDTDWPQVAALSKVLAGIAPGPVVTLNRAVAVAMADGPQAGGITSPPGITSPAAAASTSWLAGLKISCSRPPLAATPAKPAPTSPQPPSGTSSKSGTDRYISGLPATRPQM